MKKEKYCPSCKAKLLKPDKDKIIVKGIMTKTQVRAQEASVIVYSEYDMTQNGKLVLKAVYCSFCGKELGRREFA